MILTIDSETIDLPPHAGEKFTEYVGRVSDGLLKKSRCVAICQIDGKKIESPEEGDRLLATAKKFEVQSVPLQEALQASIALQCNLLRQIEDRCETLITDSLLAEPAQIIASWSSLCDSIKGVINFVPVLAGLLTEKQVDFIADNHMVALNGMMKEIAAALNRADVVTFSDLLELKLMPWLGVLREFFEEQLAHVESLGKKKS